MRRGGWFDRLLIGLACAGAVLLLSMGCDHRRCLGGHQRTSETTMYVLVGNVMMPMTSSSTEFVCDLYADGGVR